jgi:hypothetical protein
VPAGDEESSETEEMTPGYVYIYTPLPSASLSILIYMPTIACAIMILFQICWLMIVHPQVSTISAAW